MFKWISAAAMIAMLAAGCARETRQAADSGTRFEIAVTDTGFAPASITIPAGKPVTIVVTRKTDQTCAKEIVFPDQGIRNSLKCGLSGNSLAEISEVRVHPLEDVPVPLRQPRHPRSFG
jgi:plastocyanin domain-containing protein